MGQVEHDARRNVGHRGLLLGLACALVAAAGLAFSPQADARTVFSFDGERAFQVKPSTIRFGHDFSISIPNGWTGWGSKRAVATYARARWVCKYSPDWGCPGYETRESIGWWMGLSAPQRCGRDKLYTKMEILWDDQAPFNGPGRMIRRTPCKIKFGTGDSSRLSAIGSMRPKSFTVGSFESYRNVRWSRWTGPTAVARAQQVMSQSCDPTCVVRRRAVRIVLSNPGRCGGSDMVAYRQMRVYVGKRIVSREKLCTGTPI